MQKFLDINFATLNKSLQLDGVTSRRDFWYFVLFNWFVSIGASVVDIFMPGNLTQNIVSILLFVPSITAAIRRMHDTDHAGWWILFPFVNFVFLVSKGVPSRWAATS